MAFLRLRQPYPAIPAMPMPSKVRVAGSGVAEAPWTKLRFAIPVSASAPYWETNATPSLVVLNVRTKSKLFQGADEDVDVIAKVLVSSKTGVAGLAS